LYSRIAASRTASCETPLAESTANEHEFGVKKFEEVRDGGPENVSGHRYFLKFVSIRQIRGKKKILSLVFVLAYFRYWESLEPANTSLGQSTPLVGIHKEKNDDCKKVHNHPDAPDLDLGFDCACSIGPCSADGANTRYTRFLFVLL
jgi:hypothetical protein